MDKVAEALAYPLLIAAIAAGICVYHYIDTNKEKLEMQHRIKQLEAQIQCYTQEKPAEKKIDNHNI